MGSVPLLTCTFPLRAPRSRQSVGRTRHDAGEPCPRAAEHRKKSVGLVALAVHASSKGRDDSTVHTAFWLASTPALGMDPAVPRLRHALLRATRRCAIRAASNKDPTGDRGEDAAQSLHSTHL